jgi:hypothetical protein
MDQVLVLNLKNEKFKAKKFTVLTKKNYMYNKKQKITKIDIKMEKKLITVI